jgi:phytoene dehydrogenase-like protein
MHVVVIGAGVAPLVAAAELAACHDVTLCEREQSLRTEG